MDLEDRTGGQDESELRRLGLRVAELERVVAEMRAGVAPARPEGIVPMLRKRDLGYPAPPPPVPEAALPISEKQDVGHPVRVSLESRVGSQGFNLVGIVALLVGASWAFKLAIEHGLLGPVARVVLGLAAGAGLVLWSEVFRRKGMKAFSYTLKAVGSGVLYLVLWAGFHIYGVLPGTVALVAMVLVSAWNAYMAWSQDSELLAGYALVGGVLTPLLLATGGDHEGFLFTYVGAIDAATVMLLRWKRWPRLLVPAFVATVGYFIGWYAKFFHLGDTLLGWDGQATETALFALVFFALFALVSVKGWGRFEEQERHRGDVLGDVLLPLANAAFVGCAAYSVMQDSGLHEGLAWVMLGLAAVLLGLMRVQRTAVAAAMQLAAAVVFLTVAIPLKASGHTLTTAWLVEGLVLYWASTKFEEEGGAAEKALWFLSAGGYCLGLMSLGWHWVWMGVWAEFLNRELAAALVAVATLGGVVWLAAGKRRGVVVSGLVAIDAVAVLLALREVDSGWSVETHAAFANAEFWTAVVGLGMLAGVSWWAWRGVRFAVDPLIAKDAMNGARSSSRDSLGWVAGGTLVVFNLVAILSVEREIGALWHRSDANLQRSLAISGFLMAYGAMLLAVGFWRRNGFVRWQALALLIFTIAKVFLYDISGLSQGYRVVSFLALGVVLLGVSYAYQKDWLGLKDSDGGKA